MKRTAGSSYRLKVRDRNEEKIREIYLFIRILTFLLCYTVDVGLHFVISSGEGTRTRSCQCREQTIVLHETIIF